MKNKNFLTLFFLLGCVWMLNPIGASAQCNAEPNTTVSTTDGVQRVYTCPGDGIDDIIDFAHQGGNAGQYAYAITDENNIIIGINQSGSQNFEGAGTGTCRVFGFSYSGNITAQPGDLVYSTQFSDNCWFISNNAVEVVREQPDGATVSMPNGNTTTYVCIDDGAPDFVAFVNTSTSTARYTYVITDDQNNILGLPGQSFLDFSGAGVGVCRVWGLSFTGSLTAQMGDNAATVALSDGCFDLSDNFITVVRQTVDGGTVSMPNGETRSAYCTGDATDDIVEFEHVTSSTAGYTYAITDGNNIILTFTDDSSFDFSQVPSGLCRVFGFSYTGSITAEVGDLVYTTRFSDGCWAISSNAIEVDRTFVDGGTVAMPDGETRRVTCPGDGLADLVMFAHENDAPGTLYRYVITDDQNNILGLPPGNSLDFDGAGFGICRVWGLSYTGGLTAAAGDNAATTQLTDGCFELSSNFIEVVRTDVDGGTVAMPSGATERSTCAGDGVDDIVMFTHQTTQAGANYRYVITDDQNNILGIPPGNSQNFEGAGGGVCRVWGLSYTGTITAGQGDNAAITTLTDGCFELSSNFITIDRTGVDGGTVALTDGSTSANTCAGDGNDDVLSFQHDNDAPGTEYAYVITDDQNNILGIPPGNSQNFEGAGVGVCRVWGLSYTGTITAGQGDNAVTTMLTDDCFELSSNFIEVNRVDDGPACNGNRVVNAQQVAVATTFSNNVKVFPNPVVNELTVQFERLESNDIDATTYQVEVFNVAGKRVYGTAYQAANGYNEFTVNANNLDAGIYMIRMSNGTDAITKRFVKD